MAKGFISMADLYTDLGIPTTHDKTIPEAEENQYYNEKMVVSNDNQVTPVNKIPVLGAFILFVALMVILHTMK